MADRLPRRRPLRLPSHDYSSAGEYFITACTRRGSFIFGEVIRAEMRLSPLGACVEAAWRSLPSRFPRVGLDAFVVMPNHVHGVLVLGGPSSSGSAIPRLGVVVGAFKAEAAAAIEAGTGFPARRVWQRGYYDHIIASDRALSRVRDYIDENPANWAYDRENPLRSRRPCRR